MARSSFPGEFEQMVLLAVLQLGDRAHAPEISRLLEERANRQISRGALYATLDRLEQKDYVEWEVEAATSRRGGNRRRRFSVTARGIESLAASRQALVNLWNGIEGLLGHPR